MIVEGRANEYEHFRKQSDRFSETEKGEGGKRPLLTQEGRETEVLAELLVVPFFISQNVPVKKANKLCSHPTFVSPLWNTYPGGMVTKGLCPKMSF